MNIIQPIGESIQKSVIDEVQRYIDFASMFYKKEFAPIDVVFNIKGRTAGMYRSFYKKKKKDISSFDRWFPKKQSQIRFNPWLFAKYPEDSWENTIPHEVAHYITDCLYDLNKIKPHGQQWQSIMHDFGAKPVVRGEYSLEGIPLRNSAKYEYTCDCRNVKLTSIRHNRIQRGQQQYRCKDCLQTLVYIKTINTVDQYNESV